MIGRLVEYPEAPGRRYDNIDGKLIADMSYAQWYDAKTGKPV